jgi:hypothetical protein
MVRPTLVLALGTLLLAGAAMLARSPRAQDGASRQPIPSERGVAADAVAEDREAVEDLPVLESRITEFVARLKAEVFLEGGSPELAASLLEMLGRFPVLEVLREISRHAPLEHGFSVLRQLIAESPALREAVIQVLSAEADPEMQLFALRLLPGFALLGCLEREALLRQATRPLDGEFGRQLVRYVGKDPAIDGALAWLVQRLERGADPEVQGEALRALVRCADVSAVSTLKRWFEDPDVPASQRARFLAALSAPGKAPAVFERYPWLPGALERCVVLRPGVAWSGAEHELATYAVTILAQNGEHGKFSRLIESEKDISEPAGRALIAFALRWLPEPEAATTLASMATNPEEAPKVRLLALESLRGKTNPVVLQRLRGISSERNVPEDLQEALETLLRE